MIAKIKNHALMLFILSSLIISSIAFVFTATAFAETNERQSAVLTPLGLNGSEIVYNYFDSPNYVYADGQGLLVTGEKTLIAVSDANEITSRRDFSADKVYRHAEHGDHSEYTVFLERGTLYALPAEGEPVALETDDAITDFAVNRDTLYAISEMSVYSAKLGATGFESTVNRHTLSSADHTRISASAIAVTGDVVYIAIRSESGRKSDICSVSNDGVLTTVFVQADSIIALSGAADKHLLFALTRIDLLALTPSPAGGLIVTDYTKQGENLVSVCAYDGFVYALDTFDAVHKFTYNLNRDVTLIASSSGAEGFFNMPIGATAKNSKLYIADSMNGRIAVYGEDDDYTVIDGKQNAVSVAASGDGLLYIAYEYNKIGVFDANKTDAPQKTISDPDVGIIKQIAADSDGNVFILADTGLWRADISNGTTENIDKTQYKQIALGAGTETLYALAESKIAVFDITQERITATEYRKTPEDTLSFAVDLSGNVFALSPTAVTRISKTESTVFPLEYGGEKYSLGGKNGSILLSTVNNSYVKRGDVIVVDTYKHRVFKSDGDALGIDLVYSADYPNAVAGDRTPENFGSTRVIRTAVTDAQVFAVPTESQPIYTIKTGRRVIVPYYNIPNAREYSLILIDDIERGTLICGYVYKHALGEALEYTEPPAASCSIFSETAPVYKWPSRNAQTLAGFSPATRNSSFSVKDFVAEYRDDYGYLWYRIEVGAGYDGYVRSVDVSLKNYEPIFIRPAYNAEVISYKGSSEAKVYERDGDEYGEFSALATGTRVEVVGTFDTSERYTLIKYLDPVLGTRTCYIETVYLEYNGVNIVPIVATIVIIVTVILALLIIVKFSQNKNKKSETVAEDTD